MDEFLDKYLNITNKNNNIEITLLQNYNKNMANAQIDIEHFLAHIQSKHNTRYNLTKHIIYRYDNNFIISTDKNNEYITTKTIENNKYTIYGKKINIAFKEILSSNPLVSVNKYHDISSKEIFTINLKYFDLHISYDYTQKYGTIKIVIKKPFQKKEILSSLKDILDY